MLSGNLPDSFSSNLHKARRSHQGEFRPMNKAQAKLEHLDRELSTKGLTKISVAITGGDLVTISANELGLSSTEAAAALRRFLTACLDEIAGKVAEQPVEIDPPTQQEHSTGDDDEFGPSY